MEEDLETKEEVEREMDGIDARADRSGDDVVSGDGSRNDWTAKWPWPASRLRGRSSVGDIIIIRFEDGRMKIRLLVVIVVGATNGIFALCNKVLGKG